MLLKKLYNKYKSAVINTSVINNIEKIMYRIIKTFSLIILMKGDEDAFDKWYSQNTKKWKAFVNWFTKNGLNLDQEHKFYRAQYN